MIVLMMHFNCFNFIKLDEDTILDPPNFRKVLIEEYNSTWMYK